MYFFFFWLEVVHCNNVWVFVLLQPGPRDYLLQCFIKRNRSTQTYQLYLSLTNGENVVMCFSNWYNMERFFRITSDQINFYLSSENGKDISLLPLLFLSIFISLHILMQR